MDEEKEKDLAIGLSLLTPLQRKQRTRFKITLEELIGLVVKLDTQVAVCKVLGLHHTNGSIREEIEKLSGWDFKQSKGGCKISEKMIALWYELAEDKVEEAKVDSKRKLNDAILAEEIQETKKTNFSVSLDEVTQVDSFLRSLSAMSRKYLIYKLGL